MAGAHSFLFQFLLLLLSQDAAEPQDQTAQQKAAQEQGLGQVVSGRVKQS